MDDIERALRDLGRQLPASASDLVDRSWDRRGAGAGMVAVTDLEPPAGHGDTRRPSLEVRGVLASPRRLARVRVSRVLGAVALLVPLLLAVWVVVGREPAHPIARGGSGVEESEMLDRAVASAVFTPVAAGEVPAPIVGRLPTGSEVLHTVAYRARATATVLEQWTSGCDDRRMVRSPGAAPGLETGVANGQMLVWDPRVNTIGVGAAVPCSRGGNYAAWLAGNVRKQLQSGWLQVTGSGVVAGHPVWRLEHAGDPSAPEVLLDRRTGYPVAEVWPDDRGPRRTSYAVWNVLPAARAGANSASIPAAHGDAQVVNLDRAAWNATISTGKLTDHALGVAPVPDQAQVTADQLGIFDGTAMTSGAELPARVRATVELLHGKGNKRVPIGPDGVQVAPIATGSPDLTVYAVRFGDGSTPRGALCWVEFANTAFWKAHPNATGGEGCGPLPARRQFALMTLTDADVDGKGEPFFGYGFVDPSRVRGLTVVLKDGRSVPATVDRKGHVTVRATDPSMTVLGVKGYEVTLTDGRTVMSSP